MAAKELDEWDAGPPSGRRGTGRPSQAEARNAGSPPGPPPRDYV